jgi:hypothetical protein
VHRPAPAASVNQWWRFGSVMPFLSLSSLESVELRPPLCSETVGSNRVAQTPTLQVTLVTDARSGATGY